MSNGYVLAAAIDRAVAHEIGESFGLDVIDAGSIGDRDAVAAALAAAANVGLVISSAAADDAAFVELLRLIAARVGAAQLILADDGALARFDFLPRDWPAMTLADARARAQRRREMEGAPRAAPLPAPASQAEVEGPLSPERESIEQAHAEAPVEAPLPDRPAETSREPESAPEPPSAPNADAWDVYLSFHHSDQALAELFAHELRARGLRVSDYREAPIGEAIAPWIRARIDASTAVIALWSAAAAESEHAPEEVAYADRARKLNLLLIDPNVRPPQVQAGPWNWDGDVQHPVFEHILGLIMSRTQAPSQARIERPPLAAQAPAPKPPALADEAPAAGGAPPPVSAAPPQGLPAPVAPSPAPAPAEESARRPPPLAKRSAPPDADGRTRPFAADPPLRVPSQARSTDADGPGGGDQPSAAPPSSLDGIGSARADATAFAPKKLRRATPELVRIVIHQPKQLREVVKAARKIDARTEPAPQSMGIGELSFGAHVGVALEVRGGACDGALQRRSWQGEPIDFSFTVEADESAKQAVLLARVFVHDAQIGVLAFTRGITGPAKKPASAGDVRLKRHKRVFLSYSSVDRATVSAIATAYEIAGVDYFWDRTSLASGEEWSPRLRKEIDRADLFHLCWSKSAAQSEWVDKEATHALERRRRSGGKQPEITVQMLDGPPWAPHPAHLDSINFDDFVRAAIVGYTRGDGSDGG